MSRSHPPSLLTLAARTLREHAPEERILVAVSGGPDSMALLHVLAKLGRAAHAHGVDHGLRPEAAAELDRAADLAGRLGVPFTRTRLTVAAGGNLQARAREARYEALRAAAQAFGAALIATAHHADDRAETVLLRLLRGAGPAGLAVLPPRAGDRVRPLIHATRADVLAHIERHEVPYSTDPSNVDRRYLRARVRTELMPVLRELSPQIVAHLCALADQLHGQPVLGPFPRATWEALGDLARSRSSKARVALPGGLVVTYDRTKDERIRDRNANRDRSRGRD
jgi:tRNA(Ile)-lysidine synthase